MAIRGSGIQSSSASSYTVTWPAGTAAGDLALLFTAHGWPVNNPSGWTLEDQSTGSNINGSVSSRVLDATDISNGSVTVTFVNSFNGSLGILTFVGSMGGVRECVADRSASGSASVLATATSGNVLAGDTAIYWGANRGVSTDTVNRGSLQQTVSATDASGAVYAESIAVGGAVQPTFAFTTAGSGYYVTTTIVVAAPVAATARGNIDFDQIRVAARTGNGIQFLTWNNPAPSGATNTGTAGQVAWDSAGNFYWCYSVNQWARIGPGGYSNSF